MAKKEEKKAKLERTYNVPLRKEWLKAPMYKRSKKAVKALKEFMAKHMKADFDKVKIGKYVNEFIWKHGIKNPPHHVKVDATKDDEGNVFVELVGAPVVEKKEEPKKEEKKEEVKKEEPKPAEKPIPKEKEPMVKETAPAVKPETEPAVVPEKKPAVKEEATELEKALGVTEETEKKKEEKEKKEEKAAPAKPAPKKPEVKTDSKK